MIHAVLDAEHDVAVVVDGDLREVQLPVESQQALQQQFGVLRRLGTRAKGTTAKVTKLLSERARS